MGRRIIIVFTLLTMHIVALAQSLPFPVENLQLWLRADIVELTDGKVSRWFDQSPNQYEIMQTNAAARPTVTADALNGLPTVVFNGSSNYLTGGDILDLGTDCWTWIIVEKTSADGDLIGKSASGSSNGRWLFMSNQIWMHSNVSNDGNILFESDKSFRVLLWENDRLASKNKLYVNNIKGTESNTAYPDCDFNNGYDFVIGGELSSANGTFSAARRYAGQIAEIIAFNTVDSTLRMQVTEYLASRYFPELNVSVSLGLDIHCYGFADTAITTAYNPNFVSYLWSTGETDSVIHVSRPGKYWVTVTNAFGLVSSDTINVFFPEPAQLRDTTICAGDAITWNTDLDGPYTYLWSDGSTESSIEITAEGEYYVTITDTLGFKWKSDTVTVEVDDYPLTTFFADKAASHTIDTALCSGNTLGLATNVDVTASYQWNTGSSSARVALTQTGDYTLVSANAHGCLATNTAHVTVKGKAPQIAYDVSGFCIGDTTMFTGIASSEQGIESYLWIIDRTDSVTTQTFKHRFTDAGRHEAKIIVTSNNTCVSDSTFTVNIKEAPHADFSYTPVCAGVPVDLLNTSSIPDTCTVAQYEWSANDVALGTDENLSFTFGEILPVTYTLTLDNGCADDTTINVSVRNEYTTPRYVSCVSPTYGAIVGNGSVSFLWNPDDDILFYELITSSNPNFDNADTVVCNINSAVLPAGSFADTTYWKVAAYNHCMVSVVSDSRMFRKAADSGTAFATDTSLQLWLRADSIGLDENGRVSRWFDLSPNQYEIGQTSAEARPTVDDNALNGQPVLNFRLQDFMYGGDILDLGTDCWTWIIVEKTSADGDLIGKSASGSSNGRWLFMSNQIWMHSNVSNDGNILFESDKSFRVLLWENDRLASKNKLYVNNIKGTESNTAYPDCDFNNGYDFVIGGELSSANGTFSAARRYAGQIAEIIAFNTVDSTLRMQVTEYLASRYFPELNVSVSLGLDIHCYGFADTAITTAYNPNFVSYLWSTGETDSVIHVSRPGKYWVTVTNAFGLVSSDTINVFFPEPAQLRDTTICAGDTIVWNTKLDGPYTYLWSDGSTENSIEITSAGEYWLTITDTLGFKWQSDTITVKVDSFPVTAGLASDKIASCVGNNIYLQTGYEEAVSYLWSDGSTNDHFVVTEPGVYWVKIADRLGCTTADTARIEVLGIAPTPDFTHTALCATRDIEFENQSHSNDTSLINGYLWQFGDGSSSAAAHPVHAYSAGGKYSVQLTVSTTNGCSNVLKQTMIVDSLPTAAFTPAQACSGTPVQFADISSTSVSYITEWQWTINDSVFAERNPRTMFNTAGDQPVQLVVATAHGCTDTLRSTISILQGPMVDFDYSAPCLNTPLYCTNKTVSALNLAISYVWHIDGEERSTMKSPNFNLSDTGSYQIMLTAQQLSNGCSASKSKTVSIRPLPKPIISVGLLCQNQPSQVNAENTEPENVVGSWLWTIDDTKNANGQTSMLTFESAGKHHLTITATDIVGCENKADTIVVVRPTPEAAFSISPERGPVPFAPSFINRSADADSYQWVLDNTFASADEELHHTFADSGSHVIRLIATNQYGCADTTQRTAIVFVPSTDLLIMQAEVEPVGNYMRISAVVANNSPYDLVNSIISFTDNLGHSIRETITDTIKSGKILMYTFAAEIESSFNRLNYICVNVEPSIGNDM